VTSCHGILNFFSPLKLALKLRGVSSEFSPEFIVGMLSACYRLLSPEPSALAFMGPSVGSFPFSGFLTTFVATLLSSYLPEYIPYLPPGAQSLWRSNYVTLELLINYVTL